MYKCAQAHVFVNSVKQIEYVRGCVGKNVAHTTSGFHNSEVTNSGHTIQVSRSPQVHSPEIYIIR